MSCDRCDAALDAGDKIYYYRIGNPDIGWASIGVIACEAHAKLAIDRLNAVVTE